MATTNHKSSSRDFRDMLRPFTDDESAIKALQVYIGKGTDIPRQAMYTLEIINNLIQSNYGKENLYQRIPPEVFGGLPEGGRRNVEASLICRADDGTVSPKQILESGYTRIQERIGRWAEKDGCWSDTPEADQLNKSRLTNPKIDGSEARVYFDREKAQVYKTIDFSHYTEFAHFMDRITIHNATFPETAMKVEGFGLREETPDDKKEFHKGFVVIISQPFAEGRRPTMKEIEDGMSQRGYDKSENGFFYVSKMNNTAIADVHDENAVFSKEGKLLVFDCEAFLKMFPVDSVAPDKYEIKDLLPTKDGRFNESAWKSLLGDDYAVTTAQDKTYIVKQLRNTGKVNQLVGGKLIMMSPDARKIQLNDGSGRTYYDGTVLAGNPRSFRQEKNYTVKPLQYNPDSVIEIMSTITRMMPMSVDIERFLYDPELVGQYVAAFRGGSDIRDQYKEALKKTGRIDGLVNGQYIVQTDPENKGKVLISKPQSVEFMLWTNDSPIEGIGHITPDEKKALADGKCIERGGATYAFNLDKGRVDRMDSMEIKLRQKQSHTVEINKKPKRVMKF